MDKQNVVYPYTREFSFIQSLKKDWSTATWMNPENIMLDERIQDKKHLFYDFTYMKYP